MADKATPRTGIGMPAPIRRTGASSVIGPEEQETEVPEAPVVAPAVETVPVVSIVEDDTDEIDYTKIRVSIATRLRADVKARMDKVAKSTGMSIQSIVEDAVVEYLDRIAPRKS